MIQALRQAIKRKYLLSRMFYCTVIAGCKSNWEWEWDNCGTTPLDYGILYIHMADRLPLIWQAVLPP
jgi:hypothetical protein